MVGFIKLLQQSTGANNYKQLSLEISRLKEEWKSMTFGEASHAKEREIRRLKAQIKEMDDYIAAKERQQADSFPSLFNAT